MMTEELLPESNNSFRIYCDLDGVLVDFNRFVEEHIGRRPHDWELDKSLKKDFWKDVDRWVKSGKEFFGGMEEMNDAHVLWSYIEKYEPTILSATGHIPNAKEEKRAWVRRHYGHAVADRALFTRAAREKAQYAGKGHILIDDREKAIQPWRAAGGIGILHTDAESTIEQLKALGL